MRKNFDIALRGHHLMALYIYLFWGGPGKILDLMAIKYGYGFKHALYAMKKFKAIYRSNLRIKIIDTLDDMCGVCKFKSNKECKSQKKAIRDTKIAQYIGLQIGNIYTSQQIIRKLRRLSKYNFSRFYRKQ